MFGSFNWITAHVIAHMLLLCFHQDFYVVVALSSFEEMTMNNEELFVDDYHFPMVADDVRNAKYYEALKQSIIPGSSKVLDVGAGTMLLSMMAVELGAAKVLGVEANPLMGKIAKEVLRGNNYTNDTDRGNIRLHIGHFEDLKRGGKHTKNAADIFVSETFDAGLIGENFLSILAHAKTEKLIKKSAIVIPHSATIFGQLLESTFSLRKTQSAVAYNVSTDRSSTSTTNSRFEDPDGNFRMGVNLEALRPHRIANAFTVRYLNEKNAVRQQLSPPIALFDYNFQEFDVRTKDFAYSCVTFKVTEDGIFDSIGLFFNLYLDRNRTIIVSNSPSREQKTKVDTVLAFDGSSSTSSSTSGSSISSNSGVGFNPTHRSQQQSSADTADCWMQAMYRVSTDVSVSKGDIVRIQVVQQANTYVFGDVGVGEHNQFSRLVKFTAVGCTHPVKIYTGGQYTSGEDQEHSFNTNTEQYIGDIPTSENNANGIQTGGGNPYKVFSGKVGQQFKFTVKSTSGKHLGMLYKIPRSNAGGTVLSASRQIPLDSFDILCPP